MRPLILAVAVSAVAQAVYAQETKSTADAVRAADRAFEARGQEVGTARAFREYMDEIDGLQFNGAVPTRGADAIFKAMGGDAPAKTKLERSPLDAWGPARGDLGVTTGTWKLTANGAPAPLVTGRYVTVWRKNAAGRWKGLIDIGNPDSK